MSSRSEKTGGSWKLPKRGDFLRLVGRSPADEGLAGCDSVDSADLLNGILHELVLAEAVERGDNIELSRNQVSLD